MDRYIFESLIVLSAQMYNMTIQIGHGLPIEDNNTDANMCYVPIKLD